MNAVILGLVMLLLVPATALAWSETYSWAAQAAGTTYNVYQCDWAGTVPCTAWVKVGSALTAATMIVTSTNPGLTQIEVEACNAIGCSRRFGSGFFHDAARAPASVPASVMAQ